MGAIYDVVSLREVNVDGREQTRLYTSTTEHVQQESICVHLAFSAVNAELLISRHAPCNKLLFLVYKFHFRRIPRNY